MFTTPTWSGVSSEVSQYVFSWFCRSYYCIFEYSGYDTDFYIRSRHGALTTTVCTSLYVVHVLARREVASRKYQTFGATFPYIFYDYMCCRFHVQMSDSRINSSMVSHKIIQLLSYRHYDTVWYIVDKRRVIILQIHALVVFFFEWSFWRCVGFGFRCSRSLEDLVKLDVQVPCLTSCHQPTSSQPSIVAVSVIQKVPARLVVQDRILPPESPEHFQPCHDREREGSSPLSDHVKKVLHGFPNPIQVQRMEFEKIFSSKTSLMAEMRRSLHSMEIDLSKLASKLVIS